MTQAVSIAQSGSNNTTFRNRIINGDMRIDQRYAGALATYTAGGGQKYTLDRWATQNDTGTLTVQRVTDAPAGFNNSVKVTVTSVITANQCFLAQQIEGYNFADMGFGTASAKTVTASFWVKSSVTGTLTFTLEDIAGTRCYPGTYVVNAANTWEYKTVVIAGETSGGNWNTTNGTGVSVIFDLGCYSSATPNTWATSDSKRATGAVQLALTSGATFQVTGVQLEKGTTATPFEQRLYGTELALCQRYCYGQNNSAAQAYYWFGNSSGISATTAFGMVQFPVTMRSKPTVTISAANTFYLDPGVTNFTSVVADQAGVNGGAIYFTGGSGMTAGYGGRFISNNTSTAKIIWEAEL